MSIARTIFLLACVVGADTCLAEEEAFPVQGQGADSLQVQVEASGLAPTVVDGPMAEQSSAIGTPVDAGILQQMRGGESSVDNEVLIDGLVGGNVAEDVVTGSNAINGDAFANTSGISTVIQNTGNNVLIQNGMVVNVQFVGP
ncbi:MAG: hypothetical protein ABWX93_01735 [Pseudoxanthomonas sp.]